MAEHKNYFLLILLSNLIGWGEVSENLLHTVIQGLKLQAFPTWQLSIFLGLRSSTGSSASNGRDKGGRRPSRQVFYRRGLAVGILFLLTSD